MSAATLRPVTGWHSEHYDNKGRWHDLLDGPIWDALMDAGEDGLTRAGIVNRLTEDRRVRAGMSYYLSWGTEQSTMAGAPLEQAYRDYPTGADPEVRFRYVIARMLEDVWVKDALTRKRERIYQGRLSVMRERRPAHICIVDTSDVQYRYRAIPESPPLVFVPLEAGERCPHCDRKITATGRKVPWRRGQGLGPSVHTRTVNLLDGLTAELAKPKTAHAKMLTEAADLLRAWLDDRGNE